MKKMTLLSIALLLPVLVSAQDLSKRWSDRTAYTLEKGKWETGLMQPFRYGLNNRIELRSTAILLPIFPNVGAKIALGDQGGWKLASEHALAYPTLLLKSLQAKGIGGMLSPEFSYPGMISVSNALLATKSMGERALLTGEVGMTFCLRAQRPAYESTIDLPLIYPRLAPCFQGVGLRMGASYKWMLSERLFLEENCKMYVITRQQDNLFAENGGTLMWAVGKSLRIRGGYFLSWGKYPFGNQFHFGPTLDLVFGSKVY